MDVKEYKKLMNHLNNLTKYLDSGISFVSDKSLLYFDLFMIEERINFEKVNLFRINDRLLTNRELLSLDLYDKILMYIDYIKNTYYKKVVNLNMDKDNKIIKEADEIIKLAKECLKYDISVKDKELIITKLTRLDFDLGNRTSMLLTNIANNKELLKNIDKKDSKIVSVESSILEDKNNLIIISNLRKYVNSLINSNSKVKRR